MRRFPIIIPMLCLMLLPSCHNYRKLEKQMMEFTSRELILPTHLLKLDGEAVEDCSWPDSSKVFVSWYGPEECSFCAVTHLNMLEAGIAYLCESNGVLPMVVFTSPDTDISDLISTYRQSYINFPVYIDIENVFSEFSEIPADLRFHRFLVGVDGRPIFVGNPKGTKRLEELFLTACREH